MALTRGTARRYAEAAFQVAERDASVDAWLTALAFADERLAAPEAMRILASPAVPAAARLRILDRLLDGQVVGKPQHLLALLVRRGRIELLPAVRREFRRLHHHRQNIVEATVTSAVALTPSDADALRDRLAALTGSRVELCQEVDPELLGGLSVRIGDRLIDGSVRGRLERLRSELTTIAT